MKPVPPRAYNPHRPATRPPKPAEPSRKRRRQASAHAPVPTRHASRKRPPNHAEIRRTRRRVLTILYLLLTVEIVAALLTSPRLAIRHTVLRGAAGETPAENTALLQAIALPANVNWFRAPLGSLQKQMQGLAWVREAHVARRFPNTLIANVEERTPQAAVLADGHFYEVDETGVVIRLARRERLALLPHVTLAASAALVPGQAVASSGLRAALHVAATVPSNSPLHGAKIEVDQVDNLCLNMNDGMRILFGSADAIDEKLRLAQQLYAREPDIAQRLVQVNLSVPAAPACTPRPLPPVGSPTLPVTDGSLPTAEKGGRFVLIPAQAITGPTKP